MDRTNGVSQVPSRRTHYIYPFDLDLVLEWLVMFPSKNHVKFLTEDFSFPKKRKSLLNPTLLVSETYV